MTTTPTNVTTLPENSETEAVVEKQSFVQKTKTFARNHKKPLIAVGALAALVGVSAVTGRKTAPSFDAPVPDDSVEIVTHEDGSFTVQATTED